nr:unnamed protein product [Callosobruchus chinensis]
MASDVDVCRRCSDNFIVNTKIIKCDACEKVYHPACVNVKDNFSKYISECSNLFWVCDTCKECVTLKCIPTGHNTSLDSLQKDNDCLNREKDLLTKLLNELENVSQLQKFKIDAYEKQIHELKNKTVNSVKTSDGLSYSQIVKKPVLDESSVLLVKTTDKNNKDDVFKKMSNAVDPAELHVCITGTRKIRDGVAVLCKNDDEMKLLKGALSTQLGGQYLVSEAKKRKPRMLTKNVTITKQISTDELIINNIISHNDNLNCSAADLRIVTKLEIGSNYDIVLEVSASVRNTLASQGVIYLGWRRCIITDHIHIVQCFKCSKFGHVEKQCKMGDRFCSECSESHNFKACSSINKVCINCMNYNKYNKTAISVIHSARDKCCTVYQQYLSKLQTRIDYG